MSDLVINEVEINREEILNLYEQNKFLYQTLEEEVKYILDKTLREKGIKIHSILSRIKEFDSLFEKIESKQSNNPFEDITDIVGTRVVCLFLSDIDKIKSCIQDSFTIISEDNKVYGDNVSSFGYMSVHFIARLKDEYFGARYDHIKGLKFEIQVRTISMDAWANISHYLDYKNENDVPSELKRDFHALSGLFYVADTHFEMFVNASHESQLNKEEEVKNMLSNVNNQIDNEKLDFDTLKSYLNQKFNDDNNSPAKIISELLDELLRNGYTTLSKLDDDINRSSEAFQAYEIKYPPNTENHKFLPVGIIRMSLSILNKDYTRYSDGTTLMRHDTHEDPEIQRLIS